MVLYYKRNDWISKLVEWYFKLQGIPQHYTHVAMLMDDLTYADLTPNGVQYCDPEHIDQPAYVQIKLMDAFEYHDVCTRLLTMSAVNTRFHPTKFWCTDLVYVALGRTARQDTPNTLCFELQLLGWKDGYTH